MAELSRTLDVYGIHGHLAPGSDTEELLDYLDFFRKLADAGSGISVRIGEDTIALVDVAQRDGRYAFRFVSGNASDLAEAFDPGSGTTVPVELERERFIVRGAWVIVDASKRVVVIERRRPGVPVYQLERFFEKFGRGNGYSRLTVSLNPVPSPSFVEEIESFTRIREASVTIRRPNHSFTASARQAVAQIARESNGGSATVQVNADRKESLSKDHGIVSDILSFARAAINPILNATVKGSRPGYGKERTVSLKKHVLKGTAQIEETAAPIEQLNSIDATAELLIEDAHTQIDDSRDDEGDTQS